MKYKTFFLSFPFFIFSLINGFECIHDHLQTKEHFTKIFHHKNPLNDDSRGKFENHASSRRMLEEYQPIRIVADYSGIKEVSPNKRAFIEEILVPSAISYFTATLKVIPINGSLTLPSSECGQATVPSSYLEGKGEGVKADLILFVTAKDSFDEAYLAYATACFGDIYTSRPVAGHINFNSAYLQPDDYSQRLQQLSSTLHEITHILGFSEGLYEYFIDKVTLQPLGLDRVIRKVNRRGIDVNTIVLPRVIEKAKEYFGCPTLDGLDLENEDSSQAAVSHWERKILFNEYMTADYMPESVKSEFTLALLEGSGWYQVNYDMAEPLTWGKSAGCGFIDNNCIANNMATFPEFCSPLFGEGCHWGSRFKGFCGANLGNPLGVYDYWGNKTISLDPFSNNCPYYIPFVNGDCEDPLSNQSPFVVEEYGPNSKCFRITLANINEFEKEASEITTGCFKQNCLKTPGSNQYRLIVQVDKTTIECTELAERVTIPGYFGEFFCPNANEFCTAQVLNFCKNRCLGRGECVDGKCSCREGWSGKGCESQVRVANCMRCKGDLDWKFDCFGDKCISSAT